MVTGIIAASLLTPFFLEVTPEVRSTYQSLGRIVEDRPMQVTGVRFGYDSGRFGRFGIRNWDVSSLTDRGMMLIVMPFIIPNLARCGISILISPMIGALKRVLRDHGRCIADSPVPRATEHIIGGRSISRLKIRISFRFTE